MEETIWKLEWEMVKQQQLWKYYNANPMFYKNVTVITTPDKVEEDDWHKISKVGSEVDSRNQYNGLKSLIEKGELIRNVKLYKESQKTFNWEEVTI